MVLARSLLRLLGEGNWAYWRRWFCSRGLFGGEGGVLVYWWCGVRCFSHWRLLLGLIYRLRCSDCIARNHLRLDKQHLNLLTVDLSLLGVLMIVVVVGRHRVHHDELRDRGLRHLPLI